MVAIVIASSVGIGSTSSAPSLPTTKEPLAKSHKAQSQAKVLTALRSGVVARRTATWRHQDWLLIPRSKTDYRERVVKGTPYLRWLKKLWAGRADHYWDIRKNTLRDFEVKPGNRAWFKAVDEVQNIFPGTASWLLSCSDAEGGWGRWVRYGGGSYYPGYEYTDAVGNWMQYRWSTFKGHFRHALDYITGRGLRVPPHLRDPGNVRAWLSPLATALAAGWARYTGNDGNHWSASHGNGC